MPVLVPAIPPPAADVRPFWDADEPRAEGLEGMQIREQMDIAAEHWRCRTVDAIADLAPEESSYRHVPLQDAGRRQVRYVRIEPLRPRTLALDEDIE